MDLREESLKILDLLASEGIDYALCGALAVALHGCPRATKDIDILIREEDAKRVESLVAKLGFTLSSGVIPFHVGKPTERRIVRVSKAVGEDLLTLDLMLVSPILEPVWAGRIVLTVGAHPMSVVSLDGLIAMKKMAGRLQDLADIERLEELHRR